ncbi:evolved d-pantonohydrolase [Grosmannia clavigera kw1407]|uniref:Evolved d-pantonohydrolase n=1 Tax=Grosmannia clavigera (strain kw1407 / UAMH 11150) TaxID=655863 RepID=F0XCL5_GROCL|nr:evolved d-pantonohydrolase [Grosmannia clavigera kw1407]EFX04369.1 evolved d-pantonohydrolase [Grosmannia clavigera kw1407]
MTPFKPSALASGPSPLAVASALVAMLGSVYAKHPRMLASSPTAIPSQAQVIDSKSFAVLSSVPPVTSSNGSAPFVPPGHTLDSLRAQPFHVYDDAFYDILGANPTLSLVAESETDPLFHEAVIWFPDTEDIFFVQNAGAKAAGTGLAKSSIIQKVSLAAVEKAAAAGTLVQVDTVDASPQVLNPNGGTNYRGQLLFAAEGQGDQLPSALYLVNPRPPYNSTVLLNNFFGRQFSSLNDVAVHPLNRDVYFTDTLYGYLQDFRPPPGMRNQVYRFSPDTGAVTVVADGFSLPNGFNFSPDGAYAYVTDSGRNRGFTGNYHFSEPATIYRFNVSADGTLENRKTFAYADTGVPDGVHVDEKGNVYVGCGGGVQVWSPSGTLLGKIFLGTGAANFQFAGSGRMIICAETQLYYATLAATGSFVQSEL